MNWKTRNMIRIFEYFFQKLGIRFIFEHDTFGWDAKHLSNFFIAHVTALPSIINCSFDCASPTFGSPGCSRFILVCCVHSDTKRQAIDSYSNQGLLQKKNMNVQNEESRYAYANIRIVWPFKLAEWCFQTRNHPSYVSKIIYLNDWKTQNKKNAKNAWNKYTWAAY